MGECYFSYAMTRRPFIDLIVQANIYYTLLYRLHLDCSTT